MTISKGACRSVVSNQSTSVTVVHVVRAAYGIEPFKAFIDSFRKMSPGIDCNLVLAMKGFASSAEASSYLKLSKGLGAEIIFFPDKGFDLGTYFQVADQLKHERYCFLNSTCRILAPDWLANLDSALGLPNVGIVGPNGSWSSPKSYMLYRLKVPTRYRGVFPDAENVRHQFRSIAMERAGKVPSRRLGRKTTSLLTALKLPRLIVFFPSFPTPFIRTNAFMIRGSTLGLMRFPTIRTKNDSYRVESGRFGITQQVHKLGLRSLVVDRFGNTYEPEEWPRSHTSAQGNQEGLMIADIQTSIYQDGDADRRSALARMAWGLEAELDSL